MKRLAYILLILTAVGFGLFFTVLRKPEVSYVVRHKPYQETR